jgi:hypothetical protein
MHPAMRRLRDARHVFAAQRRHRAAGHKLASSLQPVMESRAMGIESRARVITGRWTRVQGDAATGSDSPTKPQAKAVGVHATASTHSLPRPSSRPGHAASASRTGTPDSARALAKVQAAHLSTQLQKLARARHEAAMRHLAHHRLAQQDIAMQAEAGRLQQQDAPDPMAAATPDAAAAPTWQTAREFGLALRVMDNGLAMAPVTRRNAGSHMLRPVSGVAHPRRLSFENIALQSLLEDMAVHDDAGDPGPRDVTRDMWSKARSVASARGLTPMAQRRLAALAPGASAGAKRRAMIEAAFEDLVQLTSVDQEIDADRILRVIHDAMTNAGMASSHGFSDAQTRSFINGLKARYPGSLGVLGMGWLLEQALAQPDRRFNRHDVLAAIGAALDARLPSSARDMLARPDPVAIGLRELLGGIRVGVGEGQPLGPMLRLVLAQLEGTHDAPDAELRAALPRLRDMLDDITETAPSVEEAFVLRELLDRIGARSPRLEDTLTPSELDLITYRGFDRQQQQLDAAQARELEVARLLSAFDGGDV